MRFRMLGPLRVRGSGGWVRIAAEQPRVVLAVLLEEAGRAVSTDRLIDAVWEDRPPRTAANTVAAYVLRLRRLIGGDAFITRGRGYELSVGDDDVDALVFERALAAARRDLHAGRLECGAVRLAGALALWTRSEPALADVPSRPALEARVAHLELLRHGAAEEHTAVLLDLGRHAEVVDDLYRLAAEQPLRERRWELLMTALQRCDRRADALAAYARARKVLSAELGVEPDARLRHLHEAILAGQRAARPVAAERPLAVPAQLPADVSGFTGRARELEALDAMLAAADGPAGAAAVCAVAGAAGVGKTALAVHWSHRVAARFSDGQLYANLRGHATPTRPIEALARFLRALGVPGERVPADVDEAGALFRSVVAGRRMLILLDDARDAEQVRPLLPGSPECLTLVTSRDRLGGLIARDGARPLALAALADGEAHRLLATLLGATRVAAEPRATAEVARLCGNLPLALRLAAADLAIHPDSSIRCWRP
ncbi:MAG TPA: AfsR/SARP family transcriptional regulator [Terriglobales bacterium]|nr:AfsR/SARP family transcriptional regulator [Terriglobales bacterium]